MYAYKTVIEVLNKCDMAYLNGDALSWFYSEEEEVITFDCVDGSIGFDINSHQPFKLTDNELELYTNDDETVYIELYCLTKPTF